jgi:hypothetical protein
MSGATSLSDDTMPLSVLPSTTSAAGQTLWFALQDKAWSSLAILPAGPGESALGVANALYDVGALVSGGPMRLLDARAVTLSTSASFILNMSSLVSAPGERRQGGTQRALVVLASVLEQMAGIPIVLAADAVVLTVVLGKTTLESARQTLELVGAERVLGCILVPPEG